MKFIWRSLIKALKRTPITILGLFKEYYSLFPIRTDLDRNFFKCPSTASCFLVADVSAFPKVKPRQVAPINFHLVRVRAGHAPQTASFSATPPFRSPREGIPLELWEFVILHNCYIWSPSAAKLICQMENCHFVSNVAHAACQLATGCLDGFGQVHRNWLQSFSGIANRGICTVLGLLGLAGRPLLVLLVN